MDKHTGVLLIQMLLPVAYQLVSMRVYPYRPDLVDLFLVHVSYPLYSEQLGRMLSHWTQNRTQAILYHDDEYCPSSSSQI
jgi:hypothetical protein